MKRIEWNRLDADARRACLARPGAGDFSFAYGVAVIGAATGAA